MKILITGARSGIGFRVAQKLARRGHFVYLTTHTNEEALEASKILADKNLKIICFKLDITKEEDRDYLGQLEIDCLICHAGIGVGGSLIDLSMDKVRENFETNYFGTFALIQKALPKLLKNPQGRIIITSSIAGIIPIPFLGSYSSTKAAISSMARALREELKLLDTKLKISLIEPGIYNTGFNDVMIDEVIAYKDQSPYFSKKMKEIGILQRRLFHFFGKNSYSSIVDKFIKATESSHPKKVYRAPLSVRILVKLYLLFFG